MVEFKKKRKEQRMQNITCKDWSADEHCKSYLGIESTQFEYYNMYIKDAFTIYLCVWGLSCIKDRQKQLIIKQKPYQNKL